MHFLSLIGLKVHRRFLSVVIQVVLAARRENMLEAVAAEIRAAGGEAIVVASDASKARYWS